mgnify:CR=1 FL=1
MTEKNTETLTSETAETPTETYYERNKAMIEKKRSRKVQCDKCKRIIKHASIYMHNKSKKCARDEALLLLETNDELELINLKHSS